MSEHEGFCLPLLEAMSREVPVLAYDATAVPETVGDGGIVFSRKDYPMVAELAERVIIDDSLRTALTTAGKNRLKDFTRAALEKSLHEALGSFVSRGL